MFFWRHLFDTHGFISRISYGHGWDNTLIVLAIAGEATFALSYLAFCTVFLLTLQGIRQDWFDVQKVVIHVLRVIGVFMVTTACCFLMHVLAIVAFWHPMYRLVGLVVVVVGLVHFGAAFKCVWAFTSSLKQPKDADA
jgi:hypothetical protein